MLLAIYPNDAEALFNKGIIWSDFKNYNVAIQCLDMSLAINPDNAKALNNKGIALRNLIFMIDHLRVDSDSDSDRI
jgi:tetratricopeptide (TPR) repeat protein